MTLTAGHDSQQLAQRNKSGSSVVERSRSDAVGSTLHGSEVTVSGRNLSLEAISVNATDATGAKGDVNIIAQENLALIAGTDTRFEHTVSVKKGGGLLRKKVTTTEHTEYSAEAVVADLTGQDINLKSGGNIDLYGTRINAQGETVLDAGGTLSAYALQNLHTVQDTRKVSRNTFGWGDVLFGINFTMAGASSKRTDTTSTQTAVVAHLQSVDSLTTKSGGDTRLQGTHIQAADTRISVGQGDKASADAKLIIEGARNRVETSHTASKKSGAWQGMSGHGETTETLTLVNIEGPVVIQAPKIVVQLPEGEFKTQLERLSSQPGQEWLLQLADRPDVDWQQVALAHEKWDYQHSGLTAEAALVIVIVVAVLTQGAGASLAGATSTTGVAVANAGFSFLASQATLSLINNNGDLGKTLSDLGSSETVKGLVATLLTAGLTAGVTQALQLPNPATNTAFLDRFITYATQAAVRAGVQSVVYGTPLDESAMTALAAALAQALTAEIGDWGVENDIENGALSKALAHASVQCAAALIGGGDCGAAAIGGVAAELLSPLAEQSGKWGTMGDRHRKHPGRQAVGCRQRHGSRRRNDGGWL